MSTLDPRVFAVREDLAAASLQDKVRAPRYAEGELRQVAAPVIPIRMAPSFDAPQVTEALSGEVLTVYDIRDGWAWVQLRGDSYVGYTPLDGISSMVEDNTHRVSARLTYLYPAPDMKRPPITKLSFSSTVALAARPEGRFVELSRGGFIFLDHLVGIRERAKEFVRVAERFVGVPYLWGGKTSLGIDCSGLVQISLQAAGVPCPRDSDMQAAVVGETINFGNLDLLQRGDLLFWQGHVAIAQSADWMIHASGHHMEVVVEPIRRAIERIGETHGPLVNVKRITIEQPPAPAPQAQATASSNTKTGPAALPPKPQPEVQEKPIVVSTLETTTLPPLPPAPPQQQQQLLRDDDSSKRHQPSSPFRDDDGPGRHQHQPPLRNDDSHTRHHLPPLRDDNAHARPQHQLPPLRDDASHLRQQPPPPPPLSQIPLSQQPLSQQNLIEEEPMPTVQQLGAKPMPFVPQQSAKPTEGVAGHADKAGAAKSK